MMKGKIFYIFLIIPGMLMINCSKISRTESDARAFVDSLTAEIEPLNTLSALAYWNATATGNDKYYDEYARLDIELAEIYSDQDLYKRLTTFKEARLKDPLLQRTIEVLYYDFLAKQTDPELLKKIATLQTALEQKFNKFRGKIDGKEVSGNDIREILAESKDLSLRKKAWLASKQVGPVVEEDLLKLVRYRNESARSMGFDNFYQLRLITGEQDPAEIERIFQELDETTRQPFLVARQELDSILARRYSVPVEELRPWHYADPFFQEAPAIADVSLDRYYQDRDVVELARHFYTSIGLNVDTVLTNSDLYERQGKYPHAYCIDIDRRGDVRIMMNVKPTERWMSTTLHELGHAVYDLKTGMNLPYLLREPAQAFTTEAVAIFFERLSKDPEWMRRMLELSADERQQIEQLTAKTLRLEKLIFARWSLVMQNFERELYSNPDRNLNKLWWDLVEKYQLIKRPEGRDMPDYAAKIHICSYPVYYHNYQLGALLAAQLRHTMAVNQGLQDTGEIRFVDNPEIGSFLVNKVFRPARRYRWDELIIRATGEQLTSAYFVEQL